MSIRIEFNAQTLTWCRLLAIDVIPSSYRTRVPLGGDRGGGHGSIRRCVRVGLVPVALLGGGRSVPSIFVDGKKWSVRDIKICVPAASSTLQVLGPTEPRVQLVAAAWSKSRTD